MNDLTRDFDKAAEKWDENPGRVKLAEDVSGAILAQVPFSADMDVLDFGCGTGLVMLKIAPLVRSATGADSSGKMLEVMAAKAEQLGLTNVRARKLHDGQPLTGAYDVIISGMTLHHVARVDEALKQMYQALKPPGILCLADLDPEQGQFHGDNAGVVHFGFDRAAMRQSLARAGFVNIRDMTAAEVVKPVQGGANRAFTVFLMIAEKNKLNEI